MNASYPKVTVIIPNWNGRQWLSDCLGALTAQRFKNFQTLVVDNASTDGSQEFIEKEYPHVTLIQLTENTGFATAVNRGIKAANTEYVALLNNDTRPLPEWLESLVKATENTSPETALLASCMLNMDNPSIIDNAGDQLTRQGAARKRGHGQPANHYSTADEILSPCGGAALYRKTLFDDVGYFDERFFAYLEDVDLGLRSQLRGYKCLYVPKAKVLHRGHGSGLPQGKYVRLITRNRLLLLFKNLPAQVLWKNLHHLLYGQFYFFVAYRKPLHSMGGLFDFLKLLPYVLRARGNNLKSAKLSWREIEMLLNRDMGEPPLLRTLWNKRRKIVE